LSKVLIEGAPAASGRSGVMVRKIVLPLVITAIVVAYWCVLFWPQFAGHYEGATSRLTVEVASSEEGLRVTLMRNDGEARQVTQFSARKNYAELEFGEDLGHQALVFHPFSGGGYDLVGGCSTIRLRKTSWLSGVAVAHPFVTLALTAAVMVVYMAIMLDAKAKTDPRVIYPMWLAYFGAMALSAVVLVVAGQARIFGYDGEPRNATAQLILTGVEFFLDVVPECQTLFGLLALFVLPQWCAYLMAGVSGTARRSRFVWFTGKWMVLLIAKTFISASAIVLSIAAVGGYYGWISAEPRNVVANVIVALTLLGCGLFLFCIVPGVGAKRGKAGATARRVHRFMRRRMRRRPGEVAAQLKREAGQRVDQTRMSGGRAVIGKVRAWGRRRR
jgi:hypothetical protein